MPDKTGQLEQPWKTWWKPCGPNDGLKDGHHIRQNWGGNAAFFSRMNEAADDVQKNGS
ncbi:hypothetical protein FH972_022188 [Carpinus fangiana]|uniref:Uncharacterized protein n=1 Tax=Carpinus fangiana TaxID=176857 RepID=A0A5N6KS52_9ROSI|nr:hypothetical protein FH972_022188 [Carpinus fangiana]